MQQCSLAILSSILMSLTFSSQAAVGEHQEGSFYQHAELIKDATQTSNDKMSHDMKAMKILHHGKVERKHAFDHHDHHYCQHYKQHGDKMRHKGKAYSNRHDASHGKSYRIKHDMMYQGGKNKIRPHEIF